LDKAVSHAYRAFFDQADFMSITLRKKISSIFSPYSNSALNNIVPDYYRVIRPELEKINVGISDILNKKDISKNNEILDEVNQYKNTLVSGYKSNKFN
jgi:hypothetical protein